MEDERSEPDLGSQRINGTLVSFSPGGHGNCTSDQNGQFRHGLAKTNLRRGGGLRGHVESYREQERKATSPRRGPPVLWRTPSIPRSS